MDNDESNYWKIAGPILYDMTVECAWCGKFLRMSKATSPGQVSHGICKTCKEKAMKEIDELYTKGKYAVDHP